ncbi:MAG: 30S ribosomal protein S8 [Candidatus Tectomicrobia bacterium]|nr:30S ribosomal protein S8 [Candidatus Tectomicrobia bacterium]
MSMTDPIADMLTRIRNAIQAKHAAVELPASRLKVRIAELLREEGYITNFTLTEDTKQGMLRITLKYLGERNAIQGLRRISKPGCRIYAGYDEVPEVLGGMGITIVSTSRGLLVDRACRRLHLGGEVLCGIW